MPGRNWDSDRAGSELTRRERHAVCRAAEFLPGHQAVVVVGDEQVAIFNVDGIYYALKDRCPHSGAPLSRGKVGGTIEWSLGGGMCVTRPGEILACPWHRWEFELSTGRSLTQPGVRVPTFAIYEEDGVIVVERGGGHA